MDIWTHLEAGTNATNKVYITFTMGETMIRPRARQVFLIFIVFYWHFLPGKLWESVVKADTMKIREDSFEYLEAAVNIQP